MGTLTSWNPLGHSRPVTGLIYLTNSTVSIKRKVSLFMFTSSAIILTVNLPSDRTNSLTRAAFLPGRFAEGRQLRCSTSTRILPSENILCQRNARVLDTAPSPKPYWSFPCFVVALSPRLTHKKMVNRCSHFHDKVHKRARTYHAQTPHWGITKPYDCKRGWRKDQGQRLSVLAGCSMASTARRKLVSLLCCRNS